MTDEPDIKDLLGRAFGQEPPLGIDRDAVVREGRKRLRRRHVLASGGVAAAVVIAAVGAATLTTVPRGEEVVPPAAGSTTSSPSPGLRLPLSTTTTVPLGGHETSGEYADALTQALYQSDVITGEVVKDLPDGPRDPAFHYEGDAYRFTGDVVFGSDSGQVTITVENMPPGAVAHCGEVPSPFIGCGIRTASGLPVAVATGSIASERRNLALVVLPDGTKVTAIASNMTSWSRTPSATDPVLDVDALVRLITEAGFDVS
jgi:hypothetical protein